MESDSALKRSLLVFFAAIAVLALYLFFQEAECDSKQPPFDIDLNADIDPDRIYTPIDSNEIRQIKESWQDFDASSDSFQIVAQYDLSKDRKIDVIEHHKEGRTHYGAVIEPLRYDPSKEYPVLLWANGLNQSNPSVDVESRIIKKLVNDLEDYLIVVPSYRGQTLIVYKRKFCSDGFFGDAFDGATDDALRLLNLVTNEFEGADQSHITACGISRGGTVVLLMGIRDPKIRNVIAIAGPTDFYSKETYQLYTSQYTYQFLSTTTSIEEIRKKILKSSPVYFVDDTKANLLLVHGRNDNIVSFSNAEAIMEIMEGRRNFSVSINNGRHKYHGWNEITRWIKAHN